MTHYTGTLPYLPVKLTIQYHLLGAGHSPGVSVSSCHQQHATQCNESVSTPAPPHTRGKVRQTCHGQSTVSTCLQNRNLAPISTDALLNYLNPLIAKHLLMAAVSNAWEKTPLQMLVVGKATVVTNETLTIYNLNIIAVCSFPHPKLPTPNHYARCILHCGPASTDLQRQMLAGHHPETLRCLGLSRSVLSDTCTDSTYAGHHPPHPLQTTRLA